MKLAADRTGKPSSIIEVSIRKAAVGLIIAACIQVAACAVVARSGYPAIFIEIGCPLFFALTAAGIARLLASSRPSAWMIVLCGLFAVFSLTATWSVKGHYTGGLNVAEPLIGLGAFGAGMANELPSRLAGLGLIVCHRGALVLAGTGLQSEHAFLAVIECGSLASAILGSVVIRRYSSKLDGPEAARQWDTAEDAFRGLQAAAARERRRLMHDAPVYRLQMIGDRAMRDSPEFRADCADDAELLRGRVPLSEPARSLAEALDDLVLDFRNRRLLVRLTHGDRGAYPDEPRVVTALKRAVEQALVNVLSHSGRAEADVIAASKGGGRIEVQVRDRGRGFSQVSAPGRLGFRYSVEQRMRDVGGDAHTSSAPGVGTVVSIWWPR